MKNTLCLLVCLLGLSACTKNIPPINSAMVMYDYTRSPPSTVTEGGQVLPSRTLPVDQLQTLNKWFRFHRSDWGILSGPLPRSSIEVALVHEDGSQSDLSIILHWYGGEPARLLILRLKDRDGKSKDIATRTLTDDDISSLGRLLTTKQ